MNKEYPWGFAVNKFIRASMDGFFIVDMAGRFREVNSAYCQLSGYSREELLTMSVPNVEASEKPEETRKHIQEVRALGKARFERKHRRKDGGLVPIELSATFKPFSAEKLAGKVRDILSAAQIPYSH